MESKEILILGVGHNTLVYIELAEACGYIVNGLYHFDNSRTGEIYNGYPILGSYHDLFSLQSLTGLNFALSQGNNQYRSAAFSKIQSLGGNIPPLIHPSSIVSKFASINQGVVIDAQAIVNPHVTIAENTILSCKVFVAHDTKIGCNSFLAPCSMIGAYMELGDEVFVGTGANIVCGKVKQVGTGSCIGAGALVLSDVLEHTVVAGSPAKILVKEKTEKSK